MSNIEHPNHYQSDKIEVIEIIDAFNLDFYEGNIIKYVLRHNKKNGIEDLKKAQFYLNRLIKLKENE